MSSVDMALQSLTYYLRAFLGVFLSILGLIEAACRQGMTAIGIPGNLQQVVLLVVAVLFIIAVLRFFAGFLRLIIIVFLILLALHVLLPGSGL